MVQMGWWLNNQEELFQALLRQGKISEATEIMKQFQNNALKARMQKELFQTL